MSEKPELLVTVYSDYICPFCYIGHVRLARLRDQYELKVNWRFIEIHPETPAEGQSVEKIAKKSGVKKETVNLAWQDSTFEGVLNKNLLNAVSLDVTGTPTFFFGKNKLTGAVPEIALREAAESG